MRADIEPFRPPLRETDHLDPVAEFLCDGYVQIGDIAYALPVDRLNIYEPTDSERGKNRRLVSDVEPFNVVSRIRLRKPEPLCFGERLFESDPSIFHSRQYVVRSSIQDSRNPRNPIRLKPALKGGDQRDASANRRLEQHGHIIPLGQLKYFSAVFGDQLLVGGNDVLAAFDCRSHELEYLPNPSGDLDQYLHFGIVHYIKRVIGDASAAEINIPRPLDLTHGDPLHAEARIVH